MYKSIYFLGHVFFLSLLFILPYVRKVMVPRKEVKENGVIPGKYTSLQLRASTIRSQKTATDWDGAGDR